MLNLAFGQSTYYSDSLSINIRRGQKQKIKEGVWPFKAPPGYLNEPKLRTIVVDPEKASLVQWTFESYATGKYPIIQIAATLNAKGMRGSRNKLISFSTCQRLLTNPFYYGVFYIRGEIHQGTHEPLITKELFDSVQRVMRGRSKANSIRLKSYVYRGLFHCDECGCGVTMETQKGHNYLRCTKRVITNCSQPYLREESMTQQIADALICVSLPDDVADRMIGQIEAERDSSKNVIEDAKHKARKEISQLDRKLDRLTVAYLDAGAFSAAEFRKRKEESIGKKRTLLDTLVSLDEGENQRFEPVIRFLNGSKQMKYVASRGNPKELRKSLEEVGSNLTVRDRRLHWEPRGAWKLVVDSGSFAQHNTAPGNPGAVLAGETHQISAEWRRRELNPRPEKTRMAAYYMCSRFFNLNPHAEKRHPARASSRLLLARGSTAESAGQPAFCGQGDAGITLCRGYLFIRQPYEPERQSRTGLQHHCWQL